jgi:imidazolonepropionase-like amidohydrolase
MLRQELIKAQEYQRKIDGAKKSTEAPAAAANDQTATAAETNQAAGANRAADATKPAASDSKAELPPRDLRLEALASVLTGARPLLVTANRAQDIASALRLADEFKIRIWLDGAAEAYLMIPQIKQSGVPVILHPAMIRAGGDYENLSFETASQLVAAGIPVAMQSGFEAYVPKVRVVLFEAAQTAANGLSFEQALATITVDAAKILGIADRVGTLEVGKDADIALYDGDPFEYTSHCVGVLINGAVVSDKAN